VGSRTIKVKASPDGELPAEGSFTFGDGPLSVFTKFTTDYKQWAVADSPSFQNLDGNNLDNFPAAKFCGGSVKNKVTDVHPATSNDAGFTPPAEGGWNEPAKPYPASFYAGRYANTSGMATGEQLLAVAVYNSDHNNAGKAAGRKGAALAAGWLDNGFSTSWTGDATFLFHADDLYIADVYFADGGAGMRPVTLPDPVVCVSRGNI
jgi:hypothetical protein